MPSVTLRIALCRVRDELQERRRMSVLAEGSGLHLVQDGERLLAKLTRLTNAQLDRMA